MPDLTGIEAAVRWDLDGTVFGKLLDDASKLRWLPDLAYYLCHAPARTGLAELVIVAGNRWAIEETFQTSKARPAWTPTRSASTPAGSDTSPAPSGDAATNNAPATATTGHADITHKCDCSIGRPPG